MVKIISVFFFISMLSLITYADAYAKDKSPSLAPIEGTNFLLFELSDNINFSASKMIYIGEVEANFSKTWMLANRTETSRKYRKTTLQNYAESFRYQLSKQLTSAGWTVLNEAEEGVMKISAKLFNIHINGPEKVDLKNDLVLAIGKSSLELSVYDIDNKLVLHIQDTGAAGSPSDTYIETSKALNNRGFNQLFKAWANNFTVYLQLIKDAASKE